MKPVIFTNLIYRNRNADMRNDDKQTMIDDCDVVDRSSKSYAHIKIKTKVFRFKATQFDFGFTSAF